MLSSHGWVVSASAHRRKHLSGTWKTWKSTRYTLLKDSLSSTASFSLARLLPARAQAVTCAGHQLITMYEHANGSNGWSLVLSIVSAKDWQVARNCDRVQQCPA